MLPKKHKILLLSVSLVFTLMSFTSTPFKSICGDQLKDITILPYVSVNKILSDDLTQKDTTANQLIADTLVKRFRYWSGLPVIHLEGLDRNAVWQINREIANTYPKVMKHSSLAAKVNKDFYAKASIPPYMKEAAIKNQVKYVILLVFDALYHDADYQERLEDQAMVRNVTSSILSYLTSPIPLVRFDMPFRGKSMMQTIMYDVEKDKVVFLSAEYYTGRVEMRRIIKHFDQQFYLFFD